jgi:beta-lactam-binding protein with PASTA domain
VGILKTGFSAIGKLFIVAALAGSFLVGMGGAVYLSLSGKEVKVPEIVGKNFLDSEKELEGMGLKVKRRALRYSEEKPNTVLEQLPRPGETVKTGQTILVVLSQANPEGQEAPATIVKEEEKTETPATLEIPSDAKKTNKNSNVKRATATRDVVKTNSNSNTASNVSTGNGNQGATTSKSDSTTPTAPANKTNPANPANKTTTPSSTPKPSVTPKPIAAKTPVTGGDVRTRRVN